jgi:uncharacterized phiE125 gp8 family phage protein
MPTAIGAALPDAKAFLRLAGDDEDALLLRLLATAADLCERFTGLALFLADRAAVLPGGTPGWQRLPATPVAAITAVATLDPAGTPTPLPVAAYAVDIDATGAGWVRILPLVRHTRARIDYRAGLAADWASLPDPLAQGVLRLTAHLHAHRDAADDAGPPAAVTALWRPFRRMRLA